MRMNIQKINNIFIILIYRVRAKELKMFYYSPLPHPIFEKPCRA